MPMPTAKAKAKPKPKPQPKFQSQTKPKVATQIQTSALIAAEPPPSKLLNYHSYADILAAKPHTTILYQAPSHAGYIATSYLAGSFLLGFAGLTCTFF
jgi:hypothetical protein